MHITDSQYIQSKQNSHIFLAHYLPADQKADSNNSRVVILVPPFAEEMNRSKRMYVLCARLLANSGIHALCFDFSGTGDSSGEWGEFSYDDWVSDLKVVYDYAKSIASEVNFVALRFGALILADAAKDDRVSANKCIFWDPIEKGESLTRQLVRMKIAAAMADEAKKITTRDVIDSMNHEGLLESAGYHVSRLMFEDIKSKNLFDLMPTVADKTDVHWMTLGKHKDTENKWLANSFTYSDFDACANVNRMHMHPVNDVKFWMQQEVTISPRLLAVTHEVFTGEQ